jgi:O-antigen/teichoic acid export membrane protein
VSEERTLLAGTGANILGLCAGVASALGVQILLGHALVPGAFGLVTVAVQVAFVAAAGSRFGMDVAAIRLVAIGRGAGTAGHLRSLVDRCALVAFSASVLVAVLLAATSPLYDRYAHVIALAAPALPFIALTNVYLGATRGLAQMRQTLYVFWIGQPLLWIVAAGVAIAAGGATDAAVLTYDGSWLLAALAARALWRREASGFAERAASAGEVRAAVRYGLPRAPGALLAQSMFWADLWVLAAFEHGTKLDAYAAAARISQVLLLFLTSLNLVFSPFAADLHARGQRQRLDELFKRSTRWALAATLPLLIILFVAADDVLHDRLHRPRSPRQSARRPPSRRPRGRPDGRSRDRGDGNGRRGKRRRRQRPEAGAGEAPHRRPAVRERIHSARPPRGCGRDRGNRSSCCALRPSVVGIPGGDGGMWSARVRRALAIRPAGA